MARRVPEIISNFFRPGDVIRGEFALVEPKRDVQRKWLDQRKSDIQGNWWMNISFAGWELSFIDWLSVGLALFFVPQIIRQRRQIGVINEISKKLDAQEAVETTPSLSAT